MYVKRDWSESFFTDTRRKRHRYRWAWIVLYLAMIGGFLFLVDSNFGRLQFLAMQAVGQAPEPTPFASTYATQGMSRYMAGNLREAEALFRQAITQQPQNVDYLYEYGRVLTELGADDPEYYIQAVQIGDQAIQANPNDPRGYALKSRALVLSGQPEEGVTVAQVGIGIDRGFAPLYAALSSAYLAIDRYDVAIENAERAIELDPNDPYSRRIYAYSLIWVGSTDEAVDQLEQAVGLNPNLAGPYFELARLYRSQADDSANPTAQTELYALSIATYERILSLQPENARAYLRLCETYFGARDNIRAGDYCEEALQINDEYAQAWASYGQTQYSRRNYEGAIESFEQCIQFWSSQTDPDIRCYYLRGLAHYYLGDCAEAWSILSDSVNRITAVSPDPTNPVLQAAQEGLRLVTITSTCTGFQGRALPTAIPPTPVPPTPIGG